MRCFKLTIQTYLWVILVVKLSENMLQDMNGESFKS